MTFLNPLLLAGLFLAAIPFVIHLFNFRKPRKVDFSSLEFVRELKKTTMQKVRIKQWLLLLLRTLALVCLVLVFARPTLNSRLAAVVGGDARTSVGIVVDNSPSMDLRDADGGYLDQVRRLARMLTSRIEAGDDLQLITLSSTGISSFQNAASASAGVESVEIADTRRTLSAAVREMSETLESSEKVNRELYVLTDGQRSAAVDSVSAAVESQFPGYVLQVGSDSHDNISVESVRIASGIVEAGQPVSVIASVRNHSSSDIDGYIVSAFMNGSRVAQATASLPSESRVDVELTVTPQDRGWINGEIRLEDDAFPFDNTRYFGLHVPEVRRVLIVRGEESASSYVSTAIRAGSTDGRSIFQVTSIAESQLSATNLDDFDTVFLIGLNDLSSGEITSVSRYVTNGGGIVFFPSRASSLTDYNNLFAEIGGGRFEGFIGAENLGTPVTRLESYEPAHPLFEGIFEPGVTGEIERPEIFFAIDYRPVRGTEQTLMTLSNGKPLLQEIPSDGGSVLMFSVLPDPGWSDFPVRGLFVPILYRSIYYLSSSTSGASTEVITGRDGQVVIPGLSSDRNLKMVNQNGTDFSPVTRSVTGGIQAILPADLNATGLTRVLDDTTTIGLVPVNPDPQESDLAQLTPDELQDLLTQVSGVSMQAVDVTGVDSDNLQEVVTSARSGVELWRPLLLACLILLIVEMLVARLWSPESA